MIFEPMINEKNQIVGTRLKNSICVIESKDTKKGLDINLPTLKNKNCIYKTEYVCSNFKRIYLGDPANEHIT